MKCRYCNGDVSIKDSSILYQQSYGLIHICDPCGAFVGCHKGTSSPLGTELLLLNSESCVNKLTMCLIVCGKLKVWVGVKLING